MKFRKTAVACLAVLALSATACGREGSPEDTTAGEGTETAPALPTYEVATDVQIDSPTWQEAHDAGTIQIGVKADQPGLGFQNVATNEYSGFDIEIAKMIAASLGFSEEQIEFTTIASANRETALSGGQVDYYVGTYTINDKRKELVDFAGPYFIAGQSLLVTSDSDITGPETLEGKRVCSVSGSTPLQRMQDGDYGAELVAYDGYAQCVENLISGQVDAVTTDDAILNGYASQNQGQLKVVGEPFSEEPYGVGLPKGDDALREAVNDALQEHMDNGNWKAAFDATLGLGGAEAPEPPALDRY
ncbi:glutamate ABC transporter substrate-binding protein [Allostreptomyces psammosilenae]|uniref:Glutamate transport system substrate-binding protein n=1 Tax=Allostreptomyces psammosilenae TaxID=1892865 RepID=A0A852ZP89_9ACTN|nr:glutamate ABC transporter substrate-binding protein [Allostreptomyces psammosilenae]NYI03080.1 glutamate transport system substrate-binding protein [Allostreptomyces psammosilenae]